MGNIWEILKIEETKDSRAIKKAYAALTRAYNPEEYPEEFLRIRQAYEQALAYANGTNEAQTPTPSMEQTESAGTSSAEDWNLSWDLSEKNPYQDHPAILKFRELYTGKRRRDRAAWLDYFTSEDFLNVWREEAFTSELLKIVTEHEETFPPCKEFLTDLYLAYGLAGQNGQMFLENNAAFGGIESIIEITKKGPLITRFKGNDPALAAGYRDYRSLLSLSAEENWNDAAFLRLGEIIGKYILAHISDRPIQNASQYELNQRHPKSLRLLNHFFAHTELPDQAYRLLWNRLYLDTATTGKNRLFYGNLRDTVLARLPGILEKPRVNYREFNKEYGHYLFYSSHHENDEKEKADIDAFFAREDVQYALMDERYVDSHVLHYWFSRKGNAYFIHCLEAFYQNHENAPFRDRVLEMAGQWNAIRRVELEAIEDEQLLPEPGAFDFRKRPYVRYYLNTAFHLARGIRSDLLLPAYLQEHLPYSAAWAKHLSYQDPDGRTSDRRAEIDFGENILQIIFHQRYLEYRWNGQPTGPKFPWENLRGIQEETIFWLLLPITIANFEAYPEVFRELSDRLSVLPLNTEDVPVLADCICGQVCRFTEDARNSLPLWTLYRETEDRLFGCDIYSDWVLFLYEETALERTGVPNGQYQASDRDTAVSMAERLLEELVTPYSVKASIEILPEQISFQNRWRQANVLTEEQVTEEALQELLEKFFDGGSRRLELSVKAGDLVFLNDGKQFACIYFDKWKQSWYGLVSMPEVYMTVDVKDVISVPFGLGMLPNYLVYQNLNYMKKNLNGILAQATSYAGSPRSIMWAPKVYRFEAKLQYHLAKRLYGGYPAEQTRNQLMDRFFLPFLPAHIRYTDLEGRSTDLDTARNKAAVQDALSRFISDRLVRLLLTWQYEENTSEGEPFLRKRQILLLKDGGKYQMLYLDEQKRELEYLVADVREYTKDSKKIRKDRFLGKSVPAYLIHEDLLRIRDYLDLLIPQIRYPDRILGIFGEFSYSAADRLPDFFN